MPSALKSQASPAIALQSPLVIGLHVMGPPSVTHAPREGLELLASQCTGQSCPQPPAPLPPLLLPTVLVAVDPPLPVVAVEAAADNELPSPPHAQGRQKSEMTVDAKARRRMT